MRFIEVSPFSMLHHKNDKSSGVHMQQMRAPCPGIKVVDCAQEDRKQKTPNLWALAQAHARRNRNSHRAARTGNAVATAAMLLAIEARVRRAATLATKRKKPCFAEIREAGFP